MPGAVEVLRAAVEGQHQLLRVAQAKHTAFDVAGRQHQRRQAVLWLRHHPFTGDVEHADHLAARVAQGYRSAGERAEAVEVMFAAVDQRRPAFDHCRTDGIGATQRLAPATARVQVAQAFAAEHMGLTFDSQHVGLGVTEDDDASLALARDQVVQFGGDGVDQQAVALQQHAQVVALLQAQADLLALQAVQAMAQAAAPGGIDLVAQHA
ncbi:hypothetical protein D3C81_1423160 [compost metagenome]